MLPRVFEFLLASDCHATGWRNVKSMLETDQTGDWLAIVWIISYNLYHVNIVNDPKSGHPSHDKPNIVRMLIHPSLIKEERARSWLASNTRQNILQALSLCVPCYQWSEPQLPIVHWLSPLSHLSPVSQLESSSASGQCQYHDSYQHSSQHMVTHPPTTASPQPPDCPRHPQLLDYHTLHHPVWSVWLSCHRDWLGRGILEKVFISCMSD